MRKFRTTFLQPYDTTKLYILEHLLSALIVVVMYYSALLGFFFVFAPTTFVAVAAALKNHREVD